MKKTQFCQIFYILQYLYHFHYPYLMENLYYSIIYKKAKKDKFDIQKKIK